MSDETTPATHHTDAHERRIRSFVLRQGRFTPAQQRAFDQHWARYGLDYSGKARDFVATFGRDASRVLEIGFGNGEQLLHSAQAESARDFIGVEVHRPGVGRLMNALADANVGNVRLYNHDAVEVLEHEIAPARARRSAHLFSRPVAQEAPQQAAPDPARVPRTARDARRARRPLASGDGLGRLCGTHAGGAARRFALAAARAAADPAVRPEWRIETHFERRGLRLGHGTWDFIHERT
jgi:tRNA (guanine-N7-)-methyltransferase